jgi:hypothetical protein
VENAPHEGRRSQGAHDGHPSICYLFIVLKKFDSLEDLKYTPSARGSGKKIGSAVEASAQGSLGKGDEVMGLNK